MHTREQLRSQLCAMDIPRDGVLLVHSSMKAVGQAEGGAETVLDVLCEHMSDGLLLMPTHTWATINNEHNIYDYTAEPSCTGILGSLLLRLPGSVRSLHPSHSVAAWGKNAEEFVEGEHLCQTPCPRDGIMGKLLDAGGKILFLGCPLSKNTFIHGVEEWAQIPDRLGEPELRYIIMRDGSTYFTTMCPHRAPVPDISVNYAKLEAPLLELHAASEHRFGDARCILCDCSEMTRIVSEMLILEPDLFITPDPVSRRLILAVSEV